MYRQGSNLEQADSLARVTSIAAEVAAKFADAVDRDARFPFETFAALRDAHLLSEAVPKEFGGAGANMLELGRQCAALAQACSSSGMVLAMHDIQVACIARHGSQAGYFRRFLSENLVERQELVASISSEFGTFGNVRASVCALEDTDGTIRLDKNATTVSYGAHADAQLVTCRRAPDAAASDQILVLFPKGSYTLEASGGWDTLGMRGTCSPAARFSGHGSGEQVLPGAFADSAAQTMVPYSHILWSALWTGIATDALQRAATCVRAAAHRNPGTVPPNALALARAYADLQTMRNNWRACAMEFDAITAADDAAAREALCSMHWALKVNQLKIACSEAAPRLCHQALQIIGILGYKNDTPFSVGRHYRDVLSAALMISNGRIADKSASLLLVAKEY